MTDLWIITSANEQDLSWVLKNKSLISKLGAYYCGEPCIAVFPSEEQLTFLILKFGDRIIKAEITSREMLDIFTPETLSLPG
jgi:hypothetical protein